MLQIFVLKVNIYGVSENFCVPTNLNVYSSILKAEKDFVLACLFIELRFILFYFPFFVWKFLPITSVSVFTKL